MEWDIGLVTHTAVDPDGFIGIQIDGNGDIKETGIPDGEHHSPFGFHSCPLDPVFRKDGDLDPQQCGQALYAWEGAKLHVWPLEHPALVKKLPRLKPGGTAVYGATGSFHLLQGDTGNQTIYVPFALDADGKPTKAHCIELSADKASISILHSSGLSLGMKDGVATLASPNGSVCISVSNDGILLNGNVKLVGSLDIGCSPAALPLLTSAFGPTTLVKAI